METKFRIRICSDLDYEEMVADISYENQTIAMISQENGIDKMEIEIFSQTNSKLAWKVNLDDFVKIIELAKKTLIKMKKIDD